MTTKRIDSALVIAVALIGLGITLASFSFSMYAFAQGSQGLQGLQRICPQGHQCSCINGIFRDYDPQTGKVFTLNNGCIE
jgi:hypothetical protein